MGKPGAQNRHERDALLVGDLVQQQELNLAVDGLQARPDLVRLTGGSPFGEPPQDTRHPQGFHPLPAFGCVEQQRDMPVVLDAQPAMVDALIHLAGNLLAGEVFEATVVRQLIPFPIAHLLTARAVEDEHYAGAPGPADDAVGCHEHRVNLVRRRRFGRQDERHRDGGAVSAAVGHGAIPSGLFNSNIPDPIFINILSSNMPSFSYG